MKKKRSFRQVGKKYAGMSPLSPLGSIVFLWVISPHVSVATAPSWFQPFFCSPQKLVDDT